MRKCRNQILGLDILWLLIQLSHVVCSRAHGSVHLLEAKVIFTYALQKACSKDKSVKCQIFAIPGCYCMEQFGCLVGASLSPHTGSYITVNDIVLGI